MRDRLMGIAGLGLAALGLFGSRAQPAEAAATGVPWETSFEAAKARAGREGKPILLLHLFGKLDEEFC